MEAKAAHAGMYGEERDGTAIELAALLRQHQEEIATAWAELVHGSPDSSYGSLPPEDVRSLTLRGLRAMAESLETGSHTALEEYLADICPAGSEANPAISAVTEALLLCKDAAVPVIRQACGPDSTTAWVLVSELDACLRQTVVRFTGMCTAQMAEELGRERAQVATLLDMAQTVGSTLELDEVANRAAQGIAAALGVDVCMFELVDEQRGSSVLVLPIQDRSSRVSRPFNSNPSIYHEVLTTREPVTSYDVLSDPRFLPDRARQLGSKSAVGVPLLVKGKVVAVAWGYTVHDYHRFTVEEIALAHGIGNVLGLVIQNAQLHEQSKLLAVMEERARLAREIHDGVTQTLGALQLKASQLEDSLSNERVDESRGHLSELQNMISRAYADMREAMFGLRAILEPGTGLMTALRQYLAHYRAEYGLDVRLEAEEDEPAVLDEETQAQAMRVLQEALRNVRRHAGTGSASVHIERQRDGLRICVVDEGRGFDPGLLEGPEDGGHLGLHTMRERAASVGGTLTVESQPGQGTRVVLHLPLLGDGGGA